MILSYLICTIKSNSQYSISESKSIK